MFGFNRVMAKSRKPRKSPRSKPRSNPELYYVWCKKQCGSASCFTMHKRSFKHFRNYEVGKEEIEGAPEHFESVFKQVLNAMPEFQTAVSAQTVYQNTVKKCRYTLDETSHNTSDVLVRALAQKNQLGIIDERNLIVKEVGFGRAANGSGTTTVTAAPSAARATPATPVAVPVGSASAGANAITEVPDVVDLS